MLIVFFLFVLQGEPFEKLRNQWQRANPYIVSSNNSNDRHFEKLFFEIKNFFKKKFSWKVIQLANFLFFSKGIYEDSHIIVHNAQK